MKDKNEAKNRYESEETEITGAEPNQVKKAIRMSIQEKLPLLDNLTELVIYHDKEMRIVWANRTATESVGLPLEKLVGHYCYKVFHQRKEPCENCPVIKAWKTGQPQEEEIISPDGKIRFVRGYPIRDENGDINGVLEIDLEITKTKLAKELFRSLFLSSPIGIYIIQDGKFKLINPQFQKITGYSKEELLDMYSLKLVYPEDRDLVRKNAIKMLKGESLSPYEYRITTKDGETKWIMETVISINYGGKQATLGNFMDITERKKLEAQLLQAQKMEAIGTLAGGVAHDFNNILTAIQGHAELAMMNIDKADPLYRDLNQIHRSSLRAADLTRKLLLFSRKQSIEIVPLNLNRIVDDLLKMVHRLLGEDIEIHTELAPDLWTVQADRGNIEQVIMNLVVNARDAMPEGGKLTIKTENVRIDNRYCKIYSYAHPGNFVCLSVTDTGSGIKKEIIRKIFDPFFTTKGEGKGTGLGLSVVYGIVKRHEGWVNVYSEPGEGSTFKIYLKVAVNLKPEEEADFIISIKDLKGHNERILLVEDDDELRKFSSTVLTENGYIVYEASNVKEALNIFEREKGDFNLIFSDVVLPDDTGLALVEQLLSRRPNLRIILCSGYTDNKVRWPVIKEKGYRFLQKPYSITDLLRTIKESL
ncbi:MAG: hypothetical protein DRG25_05530 [Deltaproteobacteria bacterium]|nr:MAG: hypothetical protein DRG25_05530 [Deltaproteobacteria bacterium]